MSTDLNTLPKRIEEEAGKLLSELRLAGWTVTGSLYNAMAFGNWYVDLRRGDDTLRLIKDRNEYSIDDGSSVNQRQAAGLWRVFHSWDAFCEAVTRCATKPN